MALFDNLRSWGHSERDIAKMQIDPATEPHRFNASYLKSQRHVKVPIPRGGPPTLPSKGSDQWGNLVATAVVPLPKQEAFNASYLKPNPDTIVHVPPPTAYTKEGALAELRSSGEAQDAKEEISPIEKATRIRDIQEEGSENAIYWNKILLTLTQINDVKARRPLSSDEQEVESVILQRLSAYDLTAAGRPTAPVVPVAGNADVGATQKITTAIGALPTAAEIGAQVPQPDAIAAAIQPNIPQPGDIAKAFGAMQRPASTLAADIATQLAAVIPKHPAPLDIAQALAGVL